MIQARASDTTVRSGVTRDEDNGDTTAQWYAEFDAAARRSLRDRIHYSFIKTYRPVLDDAPYRSFETMAEYRAWCENHLPSWLGYGPAAL